MANHKAKELVASMAGPRGCVKFKVVWAAEAGELILKVGGLRVDIKMGGIFEGRY